MGNNYPVRAIPYNRAWSDGFMLPKGDYWVGDPCLSLPQEDWRKLFLYSEKFNNENMFGANYGGKLVVALSVERGDGRYVDNDGYTYTVDSGFIGFVPKLFLKDSKMDTQSLSKIGRFVSFKEDFQVSSNKHGILYDGINISTTYAKKKK